jgi:hypothetical protein
MVTFGAAMAGKRFIRDVDPVWPPAEAEAAGKESAGTGAKEEVKGAEKEKDDEAGKKKRRKKGKR